MSTVVEVAVQEKQVDSSKNIWFRKKGENVEIGFTPQFLPIVKECWHVLPATKGEVRQNAPLMAIETCEELLTIFSPVKGSIIKFNTSASNFPDKLTDEDVICVIGDKKKVSPYGEAEDIGELMMAQEQQLLRQRVRQEQELRRPLRFADVFAVPPAQPVPQAIAGRQIGGGFNWMIDEPVAPIPQNPEPPRAVAEDDDEPEDMEF